MAKSLLTDKKAHGEQYFTVKVQNGSEVKKLTVPVTVVTKQINTDDELTALKPADGTDLYGYYTLGDNVANTKLAKTIYWNWTTRFMGTLDGRGYTITTAANGQAGIFHELWEATIKNVTIECIYRSDAGNNIFGRGVRHTKFTNVKLIATKDSEYKPYGNDHRGWLAEQQFNNNTLTDVTIEDVNGNGSLFGQNFYDNTFSNVVVKGNYDELGYTNTKESISETNKNVPEGISVNPQIAR